MFEKLQQSLEKAFKNIKGQGRVSEINIAQTAKEVRRALTDADVEYKIANDFQRRVKDKAIGLNVLNALKPNEVFMKVVMDELVEMMGGERQPVHLNGNPAIILMAGLQGAGKTTFTGKLANYLKKKYHKKPLLVAGDTQRDAACEQLKTLAEQIDVPLFESKQGDDPIQIARDSIKYAKENHHDLVIIDTAGRLAINEEMMNQIVAIKEAVNPNEILFVVDGATGQDAVHTAKAFNDLLDYDGVVLTKLDGDTPGGAALTIRTVADKPIKFIGTGEKMENIEEFDPKGMASRILGMGDLISLAERAAQVIDEEEAKDMAEKLRKNQFTFEDFLKQIQQIKRMGNIKDLASLIPGVGKAIRDIDIKDDAFKGIEAIIYSMTPEERQKPEIINGSRRARIAKGSGTTLAEVNRLLKQFQESRKMMQMASNMKNPAALARRMKQAKAQMRHR